MIETRKHPGTPNRQAVSARKGRQASYRVARQNEHPKLKCIYPLGKCPLANGGIEGIKQGAFKCGLMLGFAAASLIFALILWLWVIPTMDGAVRQAQQAVSYEAVTA